MKYWNSYHIFWDTKIDKTYDSIVPIFEKYLETKNYGEEVEKINTIINCSPGFDFKLRKKFYKDEKILFFDLIIDYNYYMSLPSDEKKKECIASSFLRDMNALAKFKPKGFVLSDLIQDCSVFFNNIGWL